MREHVTDGRFHRAHENAVDFMETRHDLRIHTPHKRKGTRRLGAFQLHPHPRLKPDKLIEANAIPESHTTFPRKR